MNIISQTPVESLYQNSAGVWSILETPELSQELIARRKIIHDLHTTIDHNINSIDALLPIYESLTSLLLKNNRLLLYLPAALVPHCSYYHHDDIIDNYIEILLNIFDNLLYEYEPRANYTDGDEPGSSPLISPAAIIARIFVNKGLLPSKWYNNEDILAASYNDQLQTTLPEDITVIDNPKRVAWIERERLRRQTPIDYSTVAKVNLEDNLSHNLINSESEISAVLNIISTDQQLSFLYPVAIFYGSRFKGYGSQSSDLDTAIFVREQLCPAADRRIVEKLVQNKLPGAIIYWLNRDNNKLTILDHNHPLYGAPHDAHVLFNGVWVGDDEVKKMLCNMLLKPMTKSNEAARSILIKELERDLLQYRLLHRGYEAHYKTTYPVFLDEGYRWLATKLYLKYVFLP